LARNLAGQVELAEHAGGNDWKSQGSTNLLIPRRSSRSLMTSTVRFARACALGAVLTFMHALADDSAPLTGKPVGVPPAHWSDDFSFGIEFSAGVASVPADAFIPALVIRVEPDNGSGTRWRVRVRAPWSADVTLDLLAADHCVSGQTVCGTKGQPLSRGIRIRVPARPE